MIGVRHFNFLLILFILSSSLNAKNIFKDFSRPKNFGVVVNNSEYQIYRSAKLGYKGLRKLKKYLKKKNLPFPKTIIYMNDHGYKRKFPKFSQFAVEEYLAQNYYDYDFYHPYDYDYRTYVDGTNPYFPEEDIDKKRNLGKHAKKYFVPIQDNTKDGGVEAVMRVLKLVTDPQNQPVLFHCLGGKHRTGIIGLLVRYLQGGKWKSGKKKKVWIGFKRYYLNPAEYEYYKYNKFPFRKVNLQFARKFSTEQRFLKLKQEYGDLLNLNPDQ